MCQKYENWEHEYKQSLTKTTDCNTFSQLYREGLGIPIQVCE